MDEGMAPSFASPLAQELRGRGQQRPPHPTAGSHGVLLSTDWGRRAVGRPRTLRPLDPGVADDKSLLQRARARLL